MELRIEGLTDRVELFDVEALEHIEKALQRKLDAFQQGRSAINSRRHVLNSSLQIVNHRDQLLNEPLQCKQARIADVLFRPSPRILRFRHRPHHLIAGFDGILLGRFELGTQTTDIGRRPHRFFKRELRLPCCAVLLVLYAASLQAEAPPAAAVAAEESAPPATEQLAAQLTNAAAPTSAAAAATTDFDSPAEMLQQGMDKLLDYLKAHPDNQGLGEFLAAERLALGLGAELFERRQTRARRAAAQEHTYRDPFLGMGNAEEGAPPRDRLTAGQGLADGRARHGRSPSR
jgi:hypothetical protein